MEHMEQKKEIVKKVLDYIEDNIEKEINVDKIAENAGYSLFMALPFAYPYWIYVCISHSIKQIKSVVYNSNTSLFQWIIYMIQEKRDDFGYALRPCQTYESFHK